MDATTPIIDTFRRYTEAFQALDPRSVAVYFNEPALMITPQGVSTLPTNADVMQLYEGVMGDLPKRGYKGTEFSPITVRQLSEDVAEVSGGGTWKSTSGEDLMRFGMTYTLRRSGNDWRIVVAVIHDPPRATVQR